MPGINSSKIMRTQSKTKYNTSQYPEAEFSEQPNNYFSLRINPNLIKRAAEGGYMTEVAFFYFLKYKFKHSRISGKYGNPKQRIAQLAGLSQPTIDKYIKTLISHNLLFEDRGGYLLAVHNTGRRFKLKTEAAPTVSIIKQLMFSQILRDEAKHQMFMLQIKNFIRSENQVDNFTGIITPYSNYHARLSIRYISSKLNISINTARNVLKNLNTMRVIRTETADRELLIADVRPGDTDHVAGYYGHRYIKDGCMFGIQAAQHNFLMQPLTARPMTLKRYRDAMKNDKVRQLVYQYQKQLIND